MHRKVRQLSVLIAKLAILALVVWGGHRTIAAGVEQLRQNGWSLGQLRPAWAVMAGVLYLASQLPSGCFWHGVLNSLQQPVALPRALRAFYIGHLGKYVPGKALVVVLRATLVGAPRVRTSLAVVAVFYETFTTMAVGAVVAALIVIATHREQIWLILGAICLALVVGAPTIPAIFVRLLRMMRVAPNSTDSEANAVRVEAALLIRGWLTIAVGWFLAGASLWTVVRAIGVDNMDFVSDLPLCTATAALAVVLGFVSMLPAGVGVRDIAMLQLLAPRLEQLVPQQGQLLALVAVIVLRLVWFCSEAILAAVLYPLGARGRINAK